MDNDAPEEYEPSPDYAWFLLGMAAMFVLGVIFIISGRIWLSCRGRSMNDIESGAAAYRPSISTLMRYMQMKAPSLPRGTAQLFASGMYSDVRITCGKKTWNLHRSVLCTQSEFFAKACNGRFKEAKECRIDLEDDVKVVGAMLYFLYHDDYITDTHTSGTLSATMLHAKLYVLGDKYFIEHLQQAALRNLKSEIRTSWASDAFADTIVEIYDSTSAKVAGRDHELRKAVIVVAKEHAAVLFSDDDKYARFKAVVSSTPEFAADVLTNMVQEPAANTYGTMPTPKSPFNYPPATLSRYRCPNCGHYFQERLMDDQWYTHCCSGKAGIYAAFGEQWKAFRG